MLSILLYILATLSANLLATVFVTLPGGAMVAVGTLTFGATFTLRDRVHRRGRRVVYAMIAAAAVANVIMAALIGIPWRIIGASFMAIILAESADTEVYQRLYRRSWWVRVMGSNLVSVPLDTVLFTCLAFEGVFPAPVLFAIIVGDMIVKFLVGGIVALWRQNSYSVTAKIPHSLRSR